MDEQGTRHDTVFVEISERDIDDDDDDGRTELGLIGGRCGARFCRVRINKELRIHEKPTN